jgi:hypothetical protein
MKQAEQFERTIIIGAHEWVFRSKSHYPPTRIDGAFPGIRRAMSIQPVESIVHKSIAHRSMKSFNFSPSLNTTT